ncbi:hypothetical protein ACIP6P_11260 [Streptomyces sp. NPDC088729]|uniref:hypothetical protein n=1 Tax=Streptomyces sp. NPDC088729 TaxID=3365876 RepID=UPI0037F5BDB7
MTANWYLVKYVPDPFRDEPKNIGVVVESEGRGVMRFVGQRNGGFDGRRVRGVVRSPRTLKAWIEYVEYHLSSGTFMEQVQRLSSRSGQNYRIDFRGTIGQSGSATEMKAIADDLFTELIGDPGPPGTQSIDDLANELLFHRLRFPADRHVERDVSYRVRLRGEPHELGFDYRYESDRTTLLDKISLSAPEKTLRKSVHDLMFRIEHIRDYKEVRHPSFVTLYDLGKSRMSDQAEGHLRVIERYSHTVDVRSEGAAEDVADKLGVPLLQSA